MSNEVKINSTLSEHGFATWGPVVGDDARLHSEQAVRLVAAHRKLPIAAIADVLLECPIERRYLVLGTIAQARRVKVLAAVDLLLARDVAIKIHEDGEPESVYRALAEARAMARVEHPNVVHVLDTGEHDGRMYTVMELCEADLERWCVGEPWADIVARVLEAGAGLGALHAAGLVHADVKPANILINRGVAKVADLGLAGAAEHVFRVSGTVGLHGARGRRWLAWRGRRRVRARVHGVGVFVWRVAVWRAAAHVRRIVRRARVRRVRARREIHMPARLPAGCPRVLVDVLRAGLQAAPERRPALLTSRPDAGGRPIFDPVS